MKGHSAAKKSKSRKRAHMTMIDALRASRARWQIKPSSRIKPSAKAYSRLREKQEARKQAVTEGNK